jgi:hypothetical protein
MHIQVKDNLMGFIKNNSISTEGIQLPDAAIDTVNIQVMMINEAPPINPDDFFYSKARNPGDMKTALPLFRNAGVEVYDIDDILRKGIYITTAVKSPKQSYTVEKEKIIEYLPVLEHEIEMFPNLKVIMLMGDVSKKSFNMIAKKRTKKNAVPSGSTYKIRNSEFFFEGIRIFPSYIMTGGNILIEKSKCSMISDDINRMIKLI